MDITTKCRNCYTNNSDQKIGTIRHSPSFSGDKHIDAKPNFFFCSEECKKEWTKVMREKDLNSLPYLAELDQSMNYCEYFIRINGNEGIYKKDNFEFKVNGLWDYKSQLCKGYSEFKEAYIKYFGNFDRFKLHNRYFK